MRGKGRAVVTERDVRIMQFAFEQRALSFEQIHRRFFELTKQPTVHYRLGRLIKDGYLSKYGQTRNGPLIFVYGLKGKGFDKAREGYRFEIAEPYFKSDSPLHDISLTDVRVRLEKYQMFADYISENMLQACSGLANSPEYQPFAQINSDAVLVLKGPNKKFRVALEFEASSKKGFRYRKKLMQYYLSPEIVAVFYVCRDRHIENLIRNADAEFESQFESKIYTCQEDVVHSGISPLPFTNRKNATFLLK